MIPQSTEIRFEVTTKCNAHCVPCPREKLTRHQETMSTDLFMELLDKILAETDQYTHLTFSGYGEPALDPQLHKKIGYARGKGLSIMVLSHVMKMDCPVPWRYGTPVGDDILNMLIEDGEVKLVEIWKPHNWTDGRVNRIIQEDQLETCGRPAYGPLEVQVDGTIKMCCFDFDGKLTLGDLKTESLNEIFDGSFTHGNTLCKWCDQRNRDRRGILVYSSKPKAGRINMTSTIYEEVVRG